MRNPDPVEQDLRSYENNIVNQQSVADEERAALSEAVAEELKSESIILEAVSETGIEDNWDDIAWSAMREIHKNPNSVYSKQLMETVGRSLYLHTINYLEKSLEV